MKILLFFISLSCFSLPLQAQIVTVGTTPLNPPFAMVADSALNFFGFDIHIMLEICKRIEVQCKFTPVEFHQILDQIKSGRLDLGIAAIILTPSLERDGWLPSLPYLESSGRFFTLANSPINTLNDITAKRVATKQGTLFRGFALNLFNNNVQVKTYPNLMDMLSALQNQEVDVILTDGADAEYWVTNHTDIYKLIDTKLSIGAGYTIVTSPKNTELMDKINKALLMMQSDGTYLNIYNKYFTPLDSAAPVQ